MAYSCSTTAANMLGIITKTFATKGNPSILTIHGKKYFFERGKENPDGAITGTLYKMPDDGGVTVAPLMTSKGTCRKMGSVRIEADGLITRFPRVSCRYMREFEHLLYEMTAKAPDLLRDWAEGKLEWKRHPSFHFESDVFQTKEDVDEFIRMCKKYAKLEEEKMQRKQD